MEAKIKIAEDMEKGNTESLNVPGWHDALAKFTSKHVNASQDLTKKTKENEGGKEEKKEADDDQTLDT